MKNWIKGLVSLGAVLNGLAIVYLILLINPDPLFAHQYSHEQFNVYSDQPISPEIEGILDEVSVRISQSELYNEDQEFNIYLCNDHWRYFFFSRNSKSGGICNFALSRDVFIRENSIGENRVIPPPSWRFKDQDRSLTYFISHELTHSMQSHHDRFMVMKVPTHIIEGYADYIAKRPDFIFEDALQQLKDNDPVMDPKNGKYNKYHLHVAYFMDQLGYSFEELITEQPELEMVDEL